MSGTILIDANSFSKGNLRQDIEEKLFSGELRAITSLDTKFDKELSKAASQFYSNLRRAYLFATVCNRSLKNKTRQLKKNPSLKSNDPHVVAVAITSAVNVLVSTDVKLAKDFKNCRKLDQQTPCRSNCHLGNNKSRKVIRKTTRQSDVRKFLCIASCKTTHCPCMDPSSGGRTC